MSEVLITLYSHIASQLFISLFDVWLLLIVLHKTCKIKIKQEALGVVVKILIVYLVSVSTARACDGFRILFYGYNIFQNRISFSLFIFRNIFEVSGVLIWYFTLAYQLRVIFKHTIFAIQRTNVVIQWILVVMFSIGIAITIYFSVYRNNRYLGISVAIVVFIYIIGYYHMIGLFNWKLYQTLRQHKCENQETRITTIMIRSTVLVTIHGIINLLYIGTVVMFAYQDVHIIFVITYWTWATLWNIYNALCIFLMLKMNEKYYDCFCKICDSRFTKVCDRLIIKSNPDLELVNLTINSLSTA